MVPIRFRSIVADAVGRNDTSVWRMGEGAFVAAPVAPDLALRPDANDADHGYVEPAAEMRLARYEAALHTTEFLWTTEEPEIA